jgi:hypothetical protein
VIQDKQLLRRMSDALERYDPIGNYDETFDQVHERIVRSGEATKLDISALLFWKRLPRGG